MSLSNSRIENRENVGSFEPHNFYKPEKKLYNSPKKRNKWSKHKLRGTLFRLEYKSNYIIWADARFAFDSEAYKQHKVKVLHTYIPREYIERETSTDIYIRCPFHLERRASCAIAKDTRNIVKCYWCGNSFQTATFLSIILWNSKRRRENKLYNKTVLWNSAQLSLFTKQELHDMLTHDVLENQVLTSISIKPRINSIAKEQQNPGRYSKEQQNPELQHPAWYSIGYTELPDPRPQWYYIDSTNLDSDPDLPF